MTDRAFDVDVDGVRGATEKINIICEDFTTLSEYSDGTDIDWWMWGVCGLAFAENYSTSAAKIQSILEKFRPALEGIRDRVDACCDAYEAGDESSADDIDRRGAEMG